MGWGAAAHMLALSPAPPRRHRRAAHLLPSHLGVSAASLIQNVVLLSAPQVELLKQTGASGPERPGGPAGRAGRPPWVALSGAGTAGRGAGPRMPAPQRTCVAVGQVLDFSGVHCAGAAPPSEGSAPKVKAGLPTGAPQGVSPERVGLTAPPRGGCNYCSPFRR